jgi:hypothetical protein
MKETAIKKGLPKRGQFAWTKFMEGRESAKIKQLETDLKEWMSKIE